MRYSTPSLHPPVLTTDEDESLFRSRAVRPASLRKFQVARLADVVQSVSIPLTTVSRAGSFDAYVNISFPGAGGTLSPDLLVDSGSNCLILPDYSALSGLPGFAQNYKVLEYDILEPWKCPACKLRGPIRIPTSNTDFYDIPDCIFYACTGPNEKNQRTANFGSGCLGPRQLDSETVQSPIALSPDYPYAEFNYAPAHQIFEPGLGWISIGNSFLTLYKAIPDGYQMLEIIPNQPWMSLRPKKLIIAGKETEWPGALAASSIAMVDTGGGPVFLSDPEKYLWADDWPASAPLPSWIGDSFACQATSADLSITLSDDKGREFSYQVQTAKLPPLAQGLTLVMCRLCSFMENDSEGKPQNGMNIGGLSALFNYVLIDYVNARVGLKAKPPALV